MEETTQQYPVFFKCLTKAAWETLNQKADELLGYGNDAADTYSKPIIDANGKYWFIVNNEVSELVDLKKCLPIENIILKEENI